MDSKLDPRSPASAMQLCADVDLGDAAVELLRDGMNPRAFVDALLEAELELDAVRVVARALDKQAAVDWSLRVVRDALGESATDAERACLEAAAAWLTTPAEAQRRAATVAAEADGKNGYGSAAAWVAAAAAWTDGSLAPPGEIVVPPAAHLTAHASAGAVGIATASDHAVAPARRRQAIALAIELGGGSAESVGP